MYKISIIIPVLNESDTIGSLITHLINNASPSNISDIIIVDGGSTDDSQDIIASFKNVRLINSDKGRAKQMNLGTKQAKGDILYFLHADSFHQTEQCSRIIRMKPHAAVGGRLAQFLDRCGAVNGVTAMIENRMGHRRHIVFARMPHFFQTLGPVSQNNLVSVSAP